MMLGDEEVVAMAVKELLHLVWQTFAEGCVALSEEGAVATQIQHGPRSLTTTGLELIEGKHYWEAKLLSEYIGGLLYIGIGRPNLDATGISRLLDYNRVHSTDGWFACVYNGSLYGNVKEGHDRTGRYEQGDRVGLLLDRDDAPLRFFKNGAQHGPGYAAGSVTGPVVAAVQMFNPSGSARLLPNAQQPQ
jgi:hypothetical protein